MVPSGTRFVGYAEGVNLEEKKSKIVNSQSAVYTTDDIRGYKVYTALLTQQGESETEYISNGSLTVGRTYTIVDVPADGCDFTNVGAPNNDSGTSFVATGTEPNKWGTPNEGENTLSYDLGAPVAIVLENTIGNIWFSYEGSGIYIINNPEGWNITKVWYGTSGLGESGALNINPGRVTMSFETDLIIVCYNNDYTSAINGQLINTPIEIRVYN